MKYKLISVVLIFCAGFLDAAKFRCDYTYVGPGWIKYHEIPLSWKDARMLCHGEGGMLASPITELIQIIKDTMGKRDIFTGIHSTFSQGLYYTIDGIPLETIPHEWAENEPDNKQNSESCLKMNAQGKLSDVKCDELHPYICYRPNSSAEINVCGTPDTDYHFNSETNKCYKFHNEKKTFERAHFTCSAEGGHLVILNSQLESDIVRDMFTQKTNSRYIFIGFHYWGEPGEFRTIHGQTLKEAGYDVFEQGQPDNAGSREFCGSMFRSGRLNDLTCGISTTFVCEKDPRYPPICDNVDESGAVMKEIF